MLWFRMLGWAQWREQIIQEGCTGRIGIIVAFGITRQNYFRDMDSWLVKPMNRDYLVFLGVFCVVEEMFRIA